MARSAAKVGGSTVRSNLQMVADRTGTIPEGLDPPDVSEDSAYLILYFQQLRQACWLYEGMRAIGWPDLHAFAKVRGVTLSTHEVNCLLRMDTIYCRQLAKEAQRG
jgi:hypothetical protein